MKRGITYALQTLIIFIGIAALAVLLGEPHLEGRNAQATLFEIYFKDPFLAYAYVASIPFFIGLYQGFKMLEYIRNDQMVSELGVKALRTMKYCALVCILFVLGAEVMIMGNTGEDHAGGVFIGAVIILLSFIITTALVMGERIITSSMKR